MKLLSINVAKPKNITYKGKQVLTGIYKNPTQSPLMLRTLNLDGDKQADLEAHGGIYKAVYVYSIENYNYWKQKLNRDDFNYGQFGENFTVEGMTDNVIYVGDRFQVGDAIVEVTQPRVPCYKLAFKMNRPDFVKLFLRSGRTGFYLKVIQESEVNIADTFNKINNGPEQMTVQEINHLLYFDKKNIQMARKALKIPALSPGWKGSFQDMVEKQDAAILPPQDCGSGY